METEIMQFSPIFEGGKDSKYFHRLFDEELELLTQHNVHQFYFVKFWQREDQNLNVRMEEARKCLEKIKEEAVHVMSNYGTTMLEGERLISELQNLGNRQSSIRRTLAWKSEINHLLEAQDKLDFSENYAHRMLHKSNNLATEKKLLRQIKETKGKGVVDSSFSSSVENLSELTRCLYDSMQWHCDFRDEQILHKLEKLERRSKKSIKDHITLVNKISEELSKENLSIWTKIKGFKKNLETVEKSGGISVKQLRNLRVRENQVNRDIFQLRKQLDEEYSSRYERYASVMSNARELARKRDVKALEELSSQEVNTFMSKWNGSETFRYSYERSVLPSLKNRQLSRDGRISNFNEQPLDIEAPIFIKFTKNEIVARTRLILDPI